jgi:hypothetical protein
MNRKLKRTKNSIIYLFSFEIRKSVFEIKIDPISTLKKKTSYDMIGHFFSPSKVDTSRIGLGDKFFEQVHSVKRNSTSQHERH